MKKVKKLILLVLLGLVILVSVFLVRNPIRGLSFVPLPTPQLNSFIPFPDSVLAQSVLVLDVDSGTIVFEREAHLRLAPASITKMVTAIAALEIYPLGEVVEIINSYPVGRNMGLLAGEKITVENLIYGLLVHSANDAAFVLAGQTEGRIEEFVARMNQMAWDLGLRDTRFINFDGEEDFGHYSTAYDLAQLARWALGNPIFTKAVGTEKMLVTNIDGSIIHQLESTNLLLGVAPEIAGVKTGWTPEAQECFVALINLDGHRLLSVVLASPDRFGDTQKIIDWLKESLSWQDHSVHSLETAGT
ncbi:MAG: hypothetical protein ABID04_00830 [Patescibacteria group bacterium]